MLFTGNTGLGKTFLSSCIANELIKQRKTVLYQTAPVMLDTIIDYRFGKSNNSNITIDGLSLSDLGRDVVISVRDIPKTIDIINYMTFAGCSKLTSITLPDSILKIEDAAFSNCSSLTSIIIKSIKFLLEEDHYVCIKLPITEP